MEIVDEGGAEGTGGGEMSADYENTHKSHHNIHSIYICRY